jgi:hypothetical protein
MQLVDDSLRSLRADLEAAKSELAAVRAEGVKPTRDCTAEAAALSREAPAERKHRLLITA